MVAAVAGVFLAIAVAFSLGFVVRILEPVPSAPVQAVIVVVTPTPVALTPVAPLTAAAATPTVVPVVPTLTPSRAAVAVPAEPTDVPAHPTVPPTKLASPKVSAPGTSAAVPTARPAARWVQVAAEATRPRAEAVRRRVVAAGFSPVQVVVLPGPGGLVRVRVGPFPDEESAGRIAARLHGKGFAQAFVVRKGD